MSKKQLGFFTVKIGKRIKAIFRWLATLKNKIGIVLKGNVD